MTPVSSLRLFPYNYESLSRPLAIAERRLVYMSTQSPHGAPCEPIPVIGGRFDDPWEFDEQARDVAMIELEKLWDEMESLGLSFTGELVDDTVFPYLTGALSQVLRWAGADRRPSRMVRVDH